MPSTVNRRIVREEKVSDSQWRNLELAPGENPIGEEPINAKVICSLIHLSDIHICDASSPARLEFLDRIADPDNPLSAFIPYVGTYRAQEFLTAQVLEAMVSAANEISSGPLTGAPIDAVVITGDVTDNAQLNELVWYKTILDGGLVEPKSGDPNRSEASHSSNADLYDIHYYHPDGPPAGMPADRPHTLHDFPHFKGVLAASERPFNAKGLKHKWLAVHGNHDALLQGTAAPTEDLNKLAIGPNKLAKLSETADLSTLFSGFGEVGPAIYPGIEILETNEITADAKRALVKMEQWVEIHTNCGHDHGLEIANPDTAYWYRDINPEVRLIGLDTVNRYGGWQGCIHRKQFDWLCELLKASKEKYVILSSHHPLNCLFNGYVPDTEPAPALEAEVKSLLSEYPNVILWFAGHVHDHKITQHKDDAGLPLFWEIRTGSHIDWPQQSRVIEIVKTANNKIAIGTVVFDHSGPIEFHGLTNELEDPIALAGLSRLLAANDWQRQEPGPFNLEVAAGEEKDRNIWLWASDPLN